MTNRLLATMITMAIVLGVVVGWLCHHFLDTPSITATVSILSVVTDVFLRLIRMIIAPLVFSTLVLGIAKMDSVASIGRIGVETFVWFFVTSLISLTLGTFMADVLRPGSGLHLIDPSLHAAMTLPTVFDGKTFVAHLVPQSIFQAMADNEILQIVVFSLFAGVAALSLGDRATLAVEIIDQIALIMLKITGYVMMLAPAAVFAALTSTIAVQGPSVLATLAKFVGGFYLSLALLCTLFAVVLYASIGKRSLGLLTAIREPLLIAFATASSEAAYPKLLLQLERFGIPNRIASFVLPLGYSFNMAGAMMYCTFAILFIAQAYGIELNWAQKLPMLALLMISTKGLAGVPRASLVIIASTLQVFHLPIGGVALILTVDHLLDMGRTGVNVIGNSVASCTIAQWEHQLSAPSEGELQPKGEL